MSDVNDNYNEDWLKTGTWDVYRNGKIVITVEDLLAGYLPSDASVDEKQECLNHLMTLPSWIPAPQELKDEAAKFLA